MSNRIFTVYHSEMWHQRLAENQGTFNCLTGHQWKKNVPPVFQTCPTKSFTLRASFYNIISLNF